MIKEKVQYINRASRLHRVGTFKPDTYTIHETQNFKATAQNERDNLQNNDGTASFHSVVDHTQVIRCVPFTTGAYHAGTVAGNTSSLSLEICSSSLSTHFSQTWDNAVEVVAHDLKKLGWGVDRLRQHNHWSGKDCPKLIRQKGLWDKFKKDVKERMEEMENAQKQKTDFEKAREWVMKNGISDGTRGNEPVTRQQVWAMLYRAAQKGVM